jgi:hypothetical protein
MNAHEAVALPLKQRPSRRRLVAMDIENINGGAVNTKPLADVAWLEVADAIGLCDGEQVVIGVGPSSLLAAGLSRPNARLVMGRGLDGADHALIEVLRDERVAARFDEIVIASGDGIFTEVAASLALEGVKVTVVARDGSLSKRLQMAASNIITLPDHAPLLGKAA